MTLNKVYDGGQAEPSSERRRNRSSNSESLSGY